DSCRLPPPGGEPTSRPDELPGARDTACRSHLRNASRCCAPRQSRGLRSLLAELIPGPAVARDHLVGALGPGRAGLVDLDTRRGIPDLEHGLDQLPRAIDGVAAV